MNKRIKNMLVIFFLFCSLFTGLFINPTVATGYIIDGDKVYIDDEYVYLSAEPHTITKTSDVIFELESKQFGGEIDVAFGINNTNMKVKNPRLWNGSAWNPLNKEIQVVNQVHQGYDRWYLLKNVNINEDVLYRLKLTVNIVFNTSGKYFFGVKRSIDPISAGYYMDPWWNSSWNHFRPITIESDYVDADLVGFPILVTIPDAIADKCDGGDSIRFLLTDNITELPYEIEDWTDGSDRIVWANVSRVESGADTNILMYYNNSAASDNQSAVDTWDNDFLRVYHLDDNTTSNVVDSAENTTSYKTGANTPIETTGKIGKGQNFSTGNHIINLERLDNEIPSNILASTFSWWMKTGSDDSYHISGVVNTGILTAMQIMSKNFGGTGGNIELHIRDEPKKDIGVRTTADDLVNTDEWVYVTVTVSGGLVGDVDVYIDGSPVGLTTVVSTPTVSTLANFTHDCPMGARNLRGVIDGYYPGLLDEFRISTSVRNASWVKASYHSGNQTTGFLTWGDEYPISNLSLLAFSTNTTGYTSMDLNWTKNVNATHTMVRRSTTTYPTYIADGNLVYNGTADNITDSGLAPYTVFYYSAWGYNDTANNWSATYYISMNHTGPAIPTSVLATHSVGEMNISWTMGRNATNTLIVRKSGSYPTSVLDGTTIYNDTGTFNLSTIGNYYYTLYSYDAVTQLYSVGHDLEWGALQINCYDENTKDPITFDILITNQDGSETYESLDNTNPLTINVTDVPFGTNTQIHVSATGYEKRIQYKDLLEATFYNISFYLPPVETEGGDEDCNLVTYTDSVSITNPAVDAVISLTHTVEVLISVEIYNQSLYGTYGGWIFVPADKYTTYSTNVTISNTSLDVNTTMARVSYYYEYCTGGTISTPIYYIRIVETYETSSGIFERAIEDAKATFQRYINTTDSYENISVLLTDANGYVNLYLIPSQLYQIVITKDGYDTKISAYAPQPPNIYGQTTEKTFKIEQIEEEDEPIQEIYMDALILAPYNTTSVWIYYLNLNNNNSYVNFTIYDYINGSSLLTYYNISTNPNNISIYFNFSSYNLSGDILRVTATAFRTDGSTYILIKYFNVEQSRRMGGATSAPIAAILSIGICLFGLTIAHPKKVFGVVGIIVMIIAIAITAFAEQIWYIHLIQAIELILLIIIILTFKEENIHAV